MATDSRRVFFALWPDAATRKQLQRVQTLLKPGGKPVVPENLHLTLAFIGNAAPGALECMQSAAGTVAFEPFTLTLDQWGYFKKPRIAWIGATHIPAALTVLQRQLIEALETCGYEREPRTYQPHVTLARKAAPVEEVAFEPVQWRSNEFALVESTPSEGGAVYRVLRCFPAVPRE